MAFEPGRIFALALASIGLLTPFAIHLFLPVTPVLKGAFGISDALAQISFSLPLLVMAFANLVYGALADRYGRRPVLLSGLALFLFGSLLGMLADTITTLIIARVVQAIGAGCGTTLVRAIARDAYGPEKLVKVISYLTMFYTLGPMVSPTVAGLLLDHFTWRAVMIFSFASGAIIMLGTYFFVPETRPGVKLEAGQSVLGNYRELFSHPRFIAYALQPGFSTAVFFSIAAASAYVMKDMLHRPSTEFGLYFFLFPLGFFSGNFISSRIGNRVPHEIMVLAGSLILTASVATILTLLMLGYVHPLAIFLPGFFNPFAQGISMPYAQSAAMQIVPRLAGTAAGVAIFSQSFFGAIFTQIYGTMADGTLKPMIIVTGVGAALCLFFGSIPFILRMRERAKA